MLRDPGWMNPQTVIQGSCLKDDSIFLLLQFHSMVLCNFFVLPRFDAYALTNRLNLMNLNC